MRYFVTWPDEVLSQKSNHLSMQWSLPPNINDKIECQLFCPFAWCVCMRLALNCLSSILRSKSNPSTDSIICSSSFIHVICEKILGLVYEFGHWTLTKTDTLQLIIHTPVSKAKLSDHQQRSIISISLTSLAHSLSVIVPTYTIRTDYAA